MARRRYTVRYELDEDGWWYTSIPEVRGCHTQGRSLRQARKRIREALAAILDDDDAAARAELVDDVRLPTTVSKAVRVADGARKRAEAEQERASAATRSAVHQLVAETGLSVRDAAEILGLSFQRVQQLTAE